ncbi:hypothetical protein MAM1_0226d08349 [Mucor ambiguus]|uniref:Zn(2)-C6 fungal-type domain-containing protein n=1 Tax=Mucor ambiguus TaxID=91626 RepID=A0A0C9MZ10_9FUNG|nr:hypothetical protein MAM1_0226d08349 [Mucor ambiguus]
MPFESAPNSSSSTSSSHSEIPPYQHPKQQQQQAQQKVSVGRLNSFKKSCEQCRKRRRVCNSERPCAHCKEANQDCVYSVVTDHSRGVFSTQAARRLSSGSACETCRRRKTKCDGASPCNFCATNNIDCVNNSERRHVNKHHGSGKSTITGVSTAAAPGEAMDRIEDRLRRIERLMTAFTPSPLSTSSSLITNDPHHIKTGGSHKVRPCRHSVQGINVAKEQLELKSKYEIKRRASPYSSSTRYGSLSPPPHPSTPPPPPLPPTSSTTTSPVSIMRPSNSQTSIAHSMLNLSISPSSSSTMSSGLTVNQPYPLASTSSPSISTQSSVSMWPLSPPTSSGSTSKRHELDKFLMEQQLQQQQQHLPSPPNSARSTSSLKQQHDHNNEWKTSGAIPSLMDQLSKRTFATSAVDYTITHYPIYPLTPPPSQSRTSPSLQRPTSS